MTVTLTRRDFPVEGLTLAEASAIAGIGRTKLYEAIGQRRLKARKVGSRTLVLRSDLLVFLESLPEVQ
jgi:excisionase family DNA binding protein